MLATSICSGSALAVTAVLYGPLGVACTSELHEALKAAATTLPNFRYALRPVLPSDCKEVWKGVLGRKCGI